MSAILLGQKPLENPFLTEETETKHKNIEKEEKDEKEVVIEGKNKTYVISKTLGKGTFGKVKLAFNIENKNEKYACKILLKSNIKDDDDRMRCKREMDILKKMHHVNVVRTYEIISTDTTYYILMDFCAKGELFNYIVEKQHLSEEKSAFFYYQLINGIEYIHKKGVCHRDLKPENLLLTEKNKLKIIDFGLSNYFKGSLLETPCGSPCYASPEMVMGNKYNGFCIDIWSSGIILYAMLCGYLPFEEMENDEYNEVLFRNIVECNVEYPNEFITPVAKDLLCKILVKDPKKRITIEEIKLHNFYLLGELLYKQTFENMGNMNDFMYIVDNDEEKYIDFDELKMNDNKYLELEEEILKNYEDYEKNEKVDKKNKNESQTDSDAIIDIKNYDINKRRDEKENSIELLRKEIAMNANNKEENKKSENNSKKIKNSDKNKDILDKISQKISEDNTKENIPNNINEKEKINKNDKNENSSKKKEKGYNELNVEEKHEKQKLSLQTNSNIQLPLDNKDKENVLENSLGIKIFKTNKEERSQKEYSVQEEHSNYNKNSNLNLNSKEINFNNQYLKTEICPSNSKHKSKKGHCQCKLLNKKLVNSNKLAFDILKSLQRNNLKAKTPKRYTKKKLPQKPNNIQSNMQLNSMTRKRNCSYSPGINKITKNIKNNNDKNMNFQKQNYIPLSTHNNAKNSYNLLSDNILKYFDTKIFFNYKEYHKNFKPNKKFIPKKNDKNKTNNNINVYNNDNYFRINGNMKHGNNEEKKLFKNSMNKALNIKSFEYCLSTNGSKKKHPLIDKKGENFFKTNNLYGNNFNINKNSKNRISKKSFSKLKGSNYLNNIYSDNSKPILISTSKIRKSTETLKNKKYMNLNNKSNIKISKNSKSKNKSIKNNTHNLLPHKLNSIKDNIDNNIIINFNILKPNIILDQQRTTSRKTKMNKMINSNQMHNTKVERPITESNFCSTVRNNLFNRSNKNKGNCYKNIDTKQIKKSKEINQIIKSIHEMNKTKGNFNNTQNNRKRLNTEI